MGRSKDGSQNKRRGKAGLPAGVVGVTLLAGAACAESNPADASTAAPTGNVRTVDLHEVEISDVTLGSFRVFEREDPQDPQIRGRRVVGLQRLRLQRLPRLPRLQRLPRLWWLITCYSDNT